MEIPIYRTFNIGMSAYHNHNLFIIFVSLNKAKNISNNKKNNRKIIIEEFNHLEKKRKRNPKLTLSHSGSFKVDFGILSNFW